MDAFCRDHNLVTSMSRRGNCHDNAVVESFNSTIKKELIKKKIYKTRADARLEIFYDIEVFYNPKLSFHYIGGSPTLKKYTNGLLLLDKSNDG